ncbi:uncharacterized protein HD556DRAFT_1435280 [Suillus plorans]|uniref:Transposase n=1 Tax=Suillus plorans TaxID=116603 RepID=A0A9P7A9W2_9AGAM|nr:uncharacterized protein HD556DRAFT_1435280 [Suillus plorans]KAG1785108.1 hypothetical protein HD556DRAFT_1435280 [Suillus plorans]
MVPKLIWLITTLALLELLEGLKIRCKALDIPAPEVFVADNCCHVCSAVNVIFPDATMKLDVWHFIMRQAHFPWHLIIYKLILRARYATVILNSSKNPHRKEVVAEISACILKKHAEGGNPAKYWDQTEQEMRLTSTFEKWACEGTVWSAGAHRVHEEQLKHVQKGCLEHGSRVEGSHKGWNSLQRAHTSGIVTFTGLCHDFVLQRNICVAFSRASKSDFITSTHGSHHVHLINRIAKQFNNLRLEDKATSTCCLPELVETPSEEHFRLVKSSFVSMFGGLLDVKAEESPVELDMTGPKLLEPLSGEGDALNLALQSARSEILEELNIDPQLLSQPQAPFDAQLTLSCPPATTTIPTAAVAEVADTSKATSHLAAITTNTQPQPTMKRKADDIVAISENEPPGMTRSQHFFTIATRIDARAMQISSNIEFHLFMDMRAEFMWISFKMTPKQWAVATETYNKYLEEKNRANGLEMLSKIEVLVMNHVAKSDFKSRSDSETFWRRHCHAIELIKAEPGKKIRKAHTCSRCKTIMYPGPENSGYNHRRGFCADGAKQVSKIELPPPWPQPPGIFSEGKHFHPRAFLETVKQIYEQEAFATMLLDWSMTLESGTVLFKLYEELEIYGMTPDVLLTVHNSVKHLRIEYLQEHWAMS